MKNYKLEQGVRDSYFQSHRSLDGRHPRNGLLPDSMLNYSPEVAVVFDDDYQKWEITTLSDLLQYLSELLIRFDNDPKFYLKDDYRHLVGAITRTNLYIYERLDTIVLNDDELEWPWSEEFSGKKSAPSIDVIKRSIQKVEDILNEKIDSLIQNVEELPVPSPTTFTNGIYKLPSNELYITMKDKNRAYYFWKKILTDHEECPLPKDVWRLLPDVAEEADLQNIIIPDYGVYYLVNNRYWEEDTESAFLTDDEEWEVTNLSHMLFIKTPVFDIIDYPTFQNADKDTLYTVYHIDPTTKTVTEDEELTVLLKELCCETNDDGWKYAKFIILKNGVPTGKYICFNILDPGEVTIYIEQPYKPVVKVLFTNDYYVYTGKDEEGNLLWDRLLACPEYTDLIDKVLTIHQDTTTSWETPLTLPKGAVPGSILKYSNYGLIWSMPPNTFRYLGTHSVHDINESSALLVQYGVVNVLDSGFIHNDPSSQFGEWLEVEAGDDVIYIGPDGWNKFTHEEIADPLIVEKTYAELSALKDGGYLIPGLKYRITDYEATSVQECINSAHHPFDIVVEAVDATHLSEKASALWHTGDSYFDNSRVDVWELHYCFDNDTNRFAWADKNGKGVIYWMKDEWGNEAPCDFKGLIFTLGSIFNTYHISYGGYMFGGFDSNNNPIDGTILGFPKFIENKVINVNNVINTPLSIPYDILTQINITISYLKIAGNIITHYDLPQFPNEFYVYTLSYSNINGYGNFIDEHTYNFFSDTNPHLLIIGNQNTCYSTNDIHIEGNNNLVPAYFSNIKILGSSYKLSNSSSYSNNSPIRNVYIEGVIKNNNVVNLDVNTAGNNTNILKYTAPTTVLN